jgi:hypothetical protein
MLPEERAVIVKIIEITGKKPIHTRMNWEVFNSREEYLEYLKKTLQEEKEKRGIVD